MRWFLIKNGKKIGPFSPEELHQKLFNGELSFDSIISLEGSPVKRKIVDVPDIFAVSKLEVLPEVNNLEKTQIAFLNDSSTALDPVLNDKVQNNINIYENISAQVPLLVSKKNRAHEVIADKKHSLPKQEVRLPEVLNHGTAKDKLSPSQDKNKNEIPSKNVSNRNKPSNKNDSGHSPRANNHAEIAKVGGIPRYFRIPLLIGFVTCVALLAIFVMAKNTNTAQQKENFENTEVVNIPAQYQQLPLAATPAVAILKPRPTQNPAIKANDLDKIKNTREHDVVVKKVNVLKKNKDNFSGVDAIPHDWPKQITSYADLIREQNSSLISIMNVRMGKIQHSCSPCRFRAQMDGNGKLMLVSPKAQIWNRIGIKSNMTVKIRGSIMRHANLETWILVQDVLK